MTNMVFYVLYIAAALLWIILLFIGRGKYSSMIEPLEIKQFKLKDLYPVGFEILDIIHYKYNSGLDLKRIRDAKIVYGERFGEYYYHVNMAEKVTYASLSIVISFILAPMFGNPIWSLFGVFSAGVLFYYADTKITDIIKEREVSIAKDFSDMVSKMALLINAGMITREAWEHIADSGDGIIYTEMRHAVSDIRNGMSEADAYVDFSTRCGVTYIKKFISMLVQNLSKGNKELVAFLREESALSWEEKKHIVRRQGEEAANKLMLPLGLILIGIFVMILVPIVSKMGL